MTRTIGVVAALSKDEAAELASEIGAWLRERGCRVVLEEELDAGAAQRADAIVVLGGDGLMMRVAKRYPGVPLLGINFGKVGFLAAVERRDWPDALEALLAGDYKLEDNSTLAAEVHHAGRSEAGDDGPGLGPTDDQGWAINDVTIRSGVRMVDVEVYIDGRYVNTFPGDGMIVSTARGSTAYGMAAGGPILTAGVKGFAIVPISCHSPIRIPMVVAEETLIEVLLASDHEASLIIDGRPTLELRRGDVVAVRRGTNRFRLVSLESTDFYQAFRTKFNFQIRPDAVPTRRPTRVGRSAERTPAR
ncbi:MAG: NAD kinase [uncultured Thermomicrobiales bacterium]|uniref:NAD kinase n=1 Tax=uncultured Thermomicrobiales bacterium TaxID=1645740 RepID=A0A6J4VDB1_9BACT|nr:MAG: NAD kinase [uncultured Thermomicrobiales bacterium]